MGATPDFIEGSGGEAGVADRAGGSAVRQQSLRRRRRIAERAMRAHGVEVLSPGLDQHLGFTKAGEDLQVEQLVSELAAEAFAVAVLPRAGSM